MAGLALAQAAEASRIRAFDAPRPASFAERGVAVAFTTPGLALARLRYDGRERHEIVMPNLADGRGVYVAPWASLSEIMSLTVHDRMLQQLLARDAVLDPETARRAQLRIALRGFAGADAADAAPRVLASDTRLATAVNLALMVQLIHEGGLTSAEALQAAETGRAGAEFRRALACIAERAGLAPIELADRIGALSHAVAPFGLAYPRPAGRLRRLARRVGALRAALVGWARKQGGEYGDIAGLCAAAAGEAAARCGEILHGIDRRLSSPIPILRAWPRDRRFFEEAGQRLAWMLDGWKRAVVCWHEVAEATRPEQELVLAAIFRALPVLPDEADPKGAGLDLALSYRRLMRRHCRGPEPAEPAQGAAEAARRMERANLHAELL